MKLEESKCACDCCCEAPVDADSYVCKECRGGVCIDDCGDEYNRQHITIPDSEEAQDGT